MDMADERLRLSRDVVERAIQRNVTLGTAESCTGGLVCAALTDVAGSSAVVRGGVVSYAVPVKEEVLGVSPAITRNGEVGVVSGACAAAMCEGARAVLGCDVAVSTTGIAGPGGEEPGKPVGTVWFGISDGLATKTMVRHFKGSRASVREQATCEALRLMRNLLAQK